MKNSPLSEPFESFNFLDFDQYNKMACITWYLSLKIGPAQLAWPDNSQKTQSISLPCYANLPFAYHLLEWGFWIGLEKETKDRAKY